MEFFQKFKPRHPKKEALKELANRYDLIFSKAGIGSTIDP